MCVGNNAQRIFEIDDNFVRGRKGTNVTGIPIPHLGDVAISGPNGLIQSEVKKTAAEMPSRYLTADGGNVDGPKEIEIAKEKCNSLGIPQ